MISQMGLTPEQIERVPSASQLLGMAYDLLKLAEMTYYYPLIALQSKVETYKSINPKLKNI